MGRVDTIKKNLGFHDEYVTKGGMKCFAAEFLGTFVLTFFACAATIDGWSDSYNASPVHASLAAGFTLMAMIQALGSVSGCHINPAVTIAFVCTGQMQLAKAFMYIVSQIGGAIMGAAFLHAITPKDVQGTLGATIMNPQISLFQATMVEIFMTFVLVLVILVATDPVHTHAKSVAPIVIGLTVTACALSLGSYSGGSMNPAKTFGSAVITGLWANQWIYWVGPIAGGIIAAVTYLLVLKASPPVPEDTRIYAKVVREEDL